MVRPLKPRSPIYNGLVTSYYIVESDYTVVFLVAGGRYAPGWNWVWKAYRSLHRKYVYFSWSFDRVLNSPSRYRKNLKKLVGLLILRCAPPN